MSDSHDMSDYTNDYGHPDVNPMTGAVPLDQTLSGELLTSVVEKARGDSAALVVFDLDSTLLDNRPRQSAIMREYGEKKGVPALAGNQPEHWKGWDAKIAMTNSGLSAAEIGVHFDEFRQYWWDRFFTSEWCSMDLPILGAVEYTKAIRETGRRLLYVTGRHEGMREGTRESFATSGFPMPDGDGITLLMKPTLEEHDDVYKERAYGQLRGMGTVVGAFDNEPAHINGYRQGFPDAICVHLATDHSPREIKVADGIPSIRHFGSFVSG